MTDFKKLWHDWNVVILLAAAKLLIHLLTNTNYSFHRDEFLYLSLGEHLSWGFMEVPPVIAVFGKLALSLGGSLFVVRLFPALIGTLMVILIGVMVRDLGGRKWAQALACLAFIISPAFLRSNTLFQPVSFNQFCWFLSAFFIVRLIKYENPKTWYIIGIVAGVGFLTKYSVVFFYTAFLISLFLTPQRKWLRTKYPYIAIGIALIIALPNLLWQIQHNFPIMHHMAELSETQLQNVHVSGFLIGQLMMHHAAAIIWLAGWLYLFFSQKLSAYRVLGWTYLGVILLLLILSGKDYYALGAYPMLMAVGGVAFENFFETKPNWLKYGFAGMLLLLSLPAIPYGLPILKVDAMQQYCAAMKDKYGLAGPLYWEDGKLHTLPQDYADMFGWEEMAERVSRLYHSLSPAEQKSCLVFGGSYSHASPINYYRKKYDLPEVYSFVGSHLIWAPDSLSLDRQVMIDDVLHTSSPYFENITMVDSIQNKYAREPGYIYYLTKPLVDVERGWSLLVREKKQKFNF